MAEGSIFMPVSKRYILYFCFVVCAIRTKANSQDRFSEELFIKPYGSGHLLFHFQFTTIWNASITEPETFSHYRLFPKSLGDVISTYKVQELHLSLSQGLWRHEKWGYPPEDAPPGAELWVWFQPSPHIDQAWSQLVNALSGLFCSSLNFMDGKSTILPRWTFRPQGVASDGYSTDSRFMRYSALPNEIVCTENLTPFKKLLPCGSKVGLSTLFNAVKLYDAHYHSLAVHVRPVCQDLRCLSMGIELKQTLSVVFDPTKDASGYQSWNLRNVFGKPLTSQCPLASLSQVLVDTAFMPVDSTLTPTPDRTESFVRGGDQRSYAVYDVGENTKGGSSLNIGAQSSSKPDRTVTDQPPVSVHRFITGYGLEKGGIACHIQNHLPVNLTVIYMETVPWYLRVYFNSIHIENDGQQIKPYKVHFIPGKDRIRPYQLELVFRLRPNSVTKIHFEFDRAFLKWTEYPPDANHGFYVNSAVITTVLPVADHFTAPPQNASSFGASIYDQSTQFFLRLHTESLLVSLPTPDFSMPYNVICLACTVVAIAFGSLHNLTTRRFKTVDPDAKKDGILQKIKNFVWRKKKDDEKEKDIKNSSVDSDAASDKAKNETDKQTEKEKVS